MEPETNNEIDLLLRRMARGNGVARDGGVQIDERHLDADELSSYAQNVLPPAARARYTEHLAECATCRRLVTELSLSLGSAVVAAPVETVAEPSDWKKFFASLLSPIVLRYAVPALGVIVVMVVGFIVLRRQGQSEFTAKLQEPRATSNSAPSNDARAGKGFYDEQAKETDKVESQNAKTRASGNSQSGAADDRIAGAAGAAPAAAAPAREDKLMAETRPTTTPEPTPAAAAKAAPEAEPQQETVTIAKKQPETAKEKVEAESRPVNEAPRDQAAKQSDATEQHQATPAPSSNAGFSALRGLSARRAETAKPATATASAPKTGAADKDAGNSNADEETRTVAGRHFRKQGKVWIDTAYDSSTATVNMARNSDQFRALVADEPAIGTIARQLDGEVIVVWKGHAYRIR